MQFKFVKWQGAGNDFVIVNALEASEETINEYQQAAARICDRHFGIGADGLVLLLPSHCADFKMRIFNSDCTEAEMCGNATRCIARYVYEEHLTGKTKIQLETKAGMICPEIIFDNGKIHSVKVDMGEPVLLGDKIPVKGFDGKRIVREPLDVDGKTKQMTCVSMGNPHCVIFVDDVNTVNLPDIGPKIETHPLFPKKINVEFAQVKSNEHIRMRVWERGAGITLACGTGSCATLVAACLNGLISGRKSRIDLDGGTLDIEWGEDNHVYMSGPADRVFAGEYKN